MRNLNEIKDTPWKIATELKRIVFIPYLKLYFYLKGIHVGKNTRIYGKPTIFRNTKSKIFIGENFENRNWMYSNPLGINHPTIFCTWSKDAKIMIGNDVGISGGSIVSSKSISIGDGTLIGANCTIIDTDFHPVFSKNRRYDKKNIQSMPVKIGKNVFIGMNSIVLKGVRIPDHTVIPAGSIVHRKTKFT